MNIRLEKHSELEATVVVDLVKEDYQEKVDSQIKKIQKTANIKGFRPGKAPLGMINKLYGKSVIAEEIQQMASDKLNNYIKDESLDILGYPIGSEKIESSLDIDNSEEFTFAFDIGLTPSFELNIKEKDKLEQFKIEVGDKEVDEDIENARKRHAKLEDAEKSDAESIVYAEVTELGEDGKELEGGTGIKPVSFVPSMIEDKKLQKVFVGIGKDFTTECDVRLLFNNNEAVITNSLGVPKEAVNDLSDKFAVKVTEVKSRILPELNDEFFKEALQGQEVPKDEAEYKAQVKENLEKYYENEASLWLDHKIGDYLMEKHKFDLPNEFLKRWLITTKSEEYNAENIEEKYTQERDALIRRLIIDKIAAENELKSEQEEIIQEAKLYYMGMYRQYGMNIGMNDDFLTETVMKRLSENEFVSQMNDRVIYRKAYDKVKETITVKDKKTTVEKYFEHVNKNKH